MNSTDVGQKGAARGSENDAGVLRADIQRVEELLSAEKQLRKRDLDLFVKKVAEYDNVVEKKEAVVIKEREKVKNLEVAIKSIQLASDKRKADLFERESELAQLKVLQRQFDNATLAENSTQQEFELSKLKADNANLSEKASQHEVQVAELKAENAMLSEANAQLTFELAKLRNFMAVLSAKTGMMSSAQNRGDHVFLFAGAESRPFEAICANDDVRMKTVRTNSAFSASENSASEPADDFVVKRNPQDEPTSHSEEVENFVESLEHEANEDVVVDPMVDDGATNSSDSVVLGRYKTPSTMTHQRATAGSSGVETLSFDVAEYDESVSALYDDILTEKPEEKRKEEINALSLANNEAVSPANDDKEKIYFHNDSASDSCNPAAALDGRGSKLECARSPHSESAGGNDSSSSGSGSTISCSCSSVTAVVAYSPRTQRKRKSVSHEKFVSDSKRSRPNTTRPPEKSNLNSIESGSCSVSKKSLRSERGSAASGRKDKRKSRTRSRSKERGDRTGPRRSHEVKQRWNSPITRRRASPIPANRHTLWIPTPSGVPLEDFHRRRQIQRRNRVRRRRHHHRGEHRFRGSNGDGGFNRRPVYSHREPRQHQTKRH